jgi:hypothetical protein
LPIGPTGVSDEVVTVTVPTERSVDAQSRKAQHKVEPPQSDAHLRMDSAQALIAIHVFDSSLFERCIHIKTKKTNNINI